MPRGPRPRVGCYPGCIGCTIPLLLAVVAGLVLAGLQLAAAILL